MTPYILCGEITYELVAKCLEWLAKNRASPVDLWLSSEGGDLMAAMALYSALKSHPEPVTITVIGSAESCAAVLLQAADTRKISSNGFIMLHRGTTGQDGVSPEEAATTAAFMNTYFDLVDGLVYKRMKASGAKISKNRYREEIASAVFYTAEEALRAGLIDEIMEE